MTNQLARLRQRAGKSEPIDDVVPSVRDHSQFKRLEAGFTPYASLDLKMPDGKGDQTETRVLADTWIDDIAFDTQRIGCIE